MSCCNLDEINLAAICSLATRCHQILQHVPKMLQTIEVVSKSFCRHFYSLLNFKNKMSVKVVLAELHNIGKTCKIVFNVGMVLNKSKRSVITMFTSLSMCHRGHSEDCGSIWFTSLHVSDNLILQYRNLFCIFCSTSA